MCQFNHGRKGRRKEGRSALLMNKSVAKEKDEMTYGRILTWVGKKTPFKTEEGEGEEKITAMHPSMVEKKRKEKERGEVFSYAFTYKQKEKASSVFSTDASLERTKEGRSSPCRYWLEGGQRGTRRKFNSKPAKRGARFLLFLRV